MAFSSGDDFVILVCTDTNPIESHRTEDEVLISTKNIDSWTASTILQHHVVKIQANRNTLIKKSAYFLGLLSGSFSESCLNCISIEWELNSFLSILKSIHGCSIYVTPDNFISLLQGALYFGVESLLLKCKSWFSEVCSPKVLGTPEIQLDDLIHIWNFGVEGLIDFLPELCARYLARNLMWAMSSNFFGDVPHKLLSSCLSHSHLTVQSEMDRSDALLLWFSCRTEHLKCTSLTEADITDLLKQIHISHLPLWLATGKRTSSYFSKLMDESVGSTLRSMKILPTGFINELGDGDLDQLRIRLTEFSKKVDLSGCPQITSAIMLLSVLPSSSSIDLVFRKSIEQCLTDLEFTGGDQNRLLPTLPEIMSFDSVYELDISKCLRLHLETAIDCISESFPSLRKLKASHHLNFKTTTLCKLTQKCPMICEVDLTVDPSPAIPGQVTILSSSVVSNNSLEYYQYGPSLSKITKLSLDGRSDIHDFDLQRISKFLISLRWINLKGCISLTDVCISDFLGACLNLHSVIVCDTSFGMNSIRALCSSIPNFDSSSTEVGMKEMKSLASTMVVKIASQLVDSYEFTS